MKIASIQLEIKDKQSKEDRIDYVCSLMDKCKGTDLIILPELWNVGFFSYDNYVSSSEPLDGPTACAISDKARELGAYIHSGSFVEKRKEQYYNTSLLFDSRGEQIAVYRKIHLFTYQCKEPEILSPGNSTALAETNFGKIGLATCYDLRFPELFRKMALEQGVEYFLITSAWPLVRLDAWNLLNQVRALENTCYLISSNCAGTNQGMVFAGHSQVVDPLGNVLASSKETEEILLTSISHDQLLEIRNNFPVLKDARFIDIA